ncbi:tetratricopeptide repeat protein [Paraburkholderia solisilvae]|uniref:Beta-barrel assembly-enhancing protease n=1 Tax=Paraburkholderia solisilvae TaxID=624376 RepID=A0A6J5D697_9BURK|nr:tetratricopeptide repeat protein [Paraburkholderia solisilvae]CAB3748136.1 Beta-barrel assembly-enhancing protease [Paraburkholderia solisilvae]
MRRDSERSNSVPEVHAGLAGERTMLMHSAIRSSLQRAHTLHQQGALAEAQQLYKGVLAIEPNNTDALFLFAAACDQSGDAAQAEKLYAQGLRFERRVAWAFAGYGAVLVKLERYEAALAPIDEALRLDARHAPAHVAYGNAMLGLKHYAQAQQAYERALTLVPTLAEAWSNRGNALRALDRPADALISYDRALQQAPHNYATHTNRGHALRDLGRYEDALRSYRLALVVRPRVAALLSLCGMMSLMLGRGAAALVSYNEGLEITPDDVEMLYHSCVALDMLHLHDELLTRSERILGLEPGHAGAWLGKANALQALQRYDEAADAYAQALKLEPDLHTALRNQGFALRTLERHEEALQMYDNALARLGPNAQLLFGRANTLRQLGHYDDALAGYEASVAIEPTDAEGWSLRGGALQQLRRFDEALQSYRRMQELEPAKGLGFLEEAYCQLLTGNFAEGWLNYEYRWVNADTARSHRHKDRPFWSGDESIAGKTVLLHAEQGYGDTLQFCRYASLVEARGASVVLEVPTPLKPLLASLRGGHKLLSTDEPLPPFDLQCPLMSLPLAFGTDLHSIPVPVPYLFADAARVSDWRQRLHARAPSGRLKVGLTWSGNVGHNNDQNRSLSFAALAPLFALDATFVSLQQQVRERDTAALAQSSVIHFGAELRDFADTAALIENLDLVISVDTSVVHAAGALGKAVWVLLPRIPDWRWLLERNDSPWYPTAQLFRQDKPGDWPDVVERVAHELSRRIAANRHG